jgi:hypothetical protein
MYTLASLHFLRRHLGLAAADTAEDSRLLECLRAASAQIERAAGRRFLPRHAAVAHTSGITRNELLLDDDLLALTSLEDTSGSIPLEDVDRLPASGVASLLRLKHGRCFTPGETGVTVTGIWGWHDDWEDAWRSSHDGVEDDVLESTATVIHVQDADAEDGELETPRFQVGQLIAIHEEWMRIMRVDAVSNSLHVYRAVCGTTSASYMRFSNIMVYHPAPDVRDLTVRWAAWLYKQGSPVPAEFHEALLPFRRDRVLHTG